MPGAEIFYVQFSDVPDAPPAGLPPVDRLPPGKGIVRWTEPVPAAGREELRRLAVLRGAQSRALAAAGRRNREAGRRRHAPRARRRLSRRRRLIAAGLLEVGDEGLGALLVVAAVHRRDLDQRLLDIGGHALGVAADVEVCAALQPRPQLGRLRPHAVLHVGLGRVGIARPGERQAGQHLTLLQAEEFVFIEEVAVLALVAEEQPRIARRLRRHPVVQEGAERRHAGARPDHDDRRRRIGRQGEVVGALDIDLERRARRDRARQEGRGDAQPRAALALDLVAHMIDGQRQPVAIDLRRRGDRVEPRLQPLEAFDESLGVGPDAGELVHRRQNVERCRVAVGILALGQRLGLRLALAAHHVGDQLEQHVRRRRQRHVLGQHLLERLAGDREVGRRVDRLDHRRDQLAIVGRIDAEAVAHRVVEAGAREIELDMPGRLLRRALVQQGRRQEARLDRRLARVAALERRSSGSSRAAARASALAFSSSGSVAPPPISSMSFFSMRAVSLPPGTQRFSRSSACCTISSA